MTFFHQKVLMAFGAGADLAPVGRNCVQTRGFVTRKAKH